MTRSSLHILQPDLPQQRYSCHGCGDCCRDFTVQLSETDLARLGSQDWGNKLGFPPTIEFRGDVYLRQRDDGGCVFLMDDGLCRIHAEYSFDEKPAACRLFPFHLTPGHKGARLGVSFACQSIRENKGADLPSHEAGLRRIAREIPEIDAAMQPPMLTGSLRASWQEVQALQSSVDVWMLRDDVDLTTRVKGLAFVAGSLVRARLDTVRDDRFTDLLGVLFAALPQELGFRPLEPPTPGQRRMLRQAVFARVEDPKIGRVLKAGKARTAINQFLRSRRFASGRGTAPRVGQGWSADICLATTEQVEPARQVDEVAAIDDLVSRWLRATILGNRAWGFGYYLWPMVDGLQAVLLNACAVGWLARLHAVSRAELSITIEDVRAALSRIDRTSGRAKWLGAKPERLRLRYFEADDGLGRLLDRYRVVGGDIE